MSQGRRTRFGADEMNLVEKAGARTIEVDSSKMSGLGSAPELF